MIIKATMMTHDEEEGPDAHEENEEDVDVEDNRVNCHHGRRPEDVVVDRRIRRTSVVPAFCIV